MRVLIEPSSYVIHKSNLGDVAMLQVALTRFSAMWPEARIQVFTNSPDTFPSYGTNVLPLSALGRRVWFDEPLLPSRISGPLRTLMNGGITSGERVFRRKFPRLTYTLLKWKLKQRGESEEHLNAFYEAVTKADVVIANGMGGITDAFPEYAQELLDVFRLAIEHGATSAMVGQGMGPLNDRELVGIARAVLPKVNFIALREEKSGAPLLRSLDVKMDRIMTTGDDAVEIAYERRPKRLGAGLGVNLRASAYAGVDWQFAARVGTILKESAESRNAPIVPVPISRFSGEDDAKTIRQMLKGWADSDGGASVDNIPKLVTQVHRCRVVVAGSYHAAVFALSSGIPVVGMANSTYYYDKFNGLADQFGDGCTVVSLGDADLPILLSAAITSAWDSADEVRPKLLEAARRQVDLSREAYRRIDKLVREQARRRKSRFEREPAAPSDTLIRVEA